MRFEAFIPYNTRISEGMINRDFAKKLQKRVNKNPFAGKTSKGEFDHLKGRLALAELRSATGGLQTVLDGKMKEK